MTGGLGPLREGDIVSTEASLSWAQLQTLIAKETDPAFQEAAGTPAHGDGRRRGRRRRGGSGAVTGGGVEAAGTHGPRQPEHGAR